MNAHRSLLRVVLLLGLGLVILAGCEGDHGTGKDAVPWRTDFPAARAEAARSHHLVFVDFSAKWCPPCKQMERETWTDPAVADALKDMVPVHIDTDQHPELAQQYHVDGIPALFVLDADGNVIKTGGGYMNSATFIAWLKGK